MNRNFADELKDRCRKIRLGEEREEIPEIQAAKEEDSDMSPRYDIFKRTLPKYKNVAVMFGLSLEQAETGRSFKSQRTRKAPDGADIQRSYFVRSCASR